MTSTKSLRVGSVALAAILGILLISSQGVTLASWEESTEAPILAIKTGELTLVPQAGGVTYTVHSKFSGERTDFRQGTACPAPTGFVACRRFSAADLGKVALIPGDEIEVIGNFTAAAAGDNLVATVHWAEKPGLSELPLVATPITTVTRGDRPVPNGEMIKGTDPADLKVAPWRLTTKIATADKWPIKYQDTSYSLADIRIIVEQSG